jgi:phosphoribosylanthranilate isomerase
VLEFGTRVAVKVCGVTNISDALACATAGVQMIGLNFSPESVRCVGPETASGIVAAIRPRFPRIKFVGVFMNQEIELVRTSMALLALDAVQLHGEETPEYVRKLAAPFVIKAFRVRPNDSAAAAAEYPSDATLLDGWSANAPGGSGETFPWPVAVALRPLVRRLVLAGGLTSGNVAEAIRIVRPFAVDVCSGVESAPGRKDDAKVRSFLEAVRAAEEGKMAR